MLFMLLRGSLSEDDLIRGCTLPLVTTLPSLMVIELLGLTFLICHVNKWSKIYMILRVVASHLKPQPYHVRWTR